MHMLPSLTVGSVNPVLALGMPMGMEWIVIGLVALLVFGKRLPGVAKGIGQGIMEFKNGLKGNEATETAVVNTPRFDPQTGEAMRSDDGRAV